MKVKRIYAVNFRNYKECCLEITSMVNIFYGQNAQGKTNLLEAMFYAAFGMSHRTAQNCSDKIPCSFLQSIPATALLNQIPDLGVHNSPSTSPSRKYENTDVPHSPYPAESFLHLARLPESLPVHLILVTKMI